MAPMFIKLTAEFGTEVYVAVHQIIYFYRNDDTILTSIWIHGDKSALSVKQTPETIMEMINNA